MRKGAFFIIDSESIEEHRNIGFLRVLGDNKATKVLIRLFKDTPSGLVMHAQRNISINN